MMRQRGYLTTTNAAHPCALMGRTDASGRRCAAGPSLHQPRGGMDHGDYRPSPRPPPTRPPRHPPLPQRPPLVAPLPAAPKPPRPHPPKKATAPRRDAATAAAKPSSSARGKRQAEDKAGPVSPGVVDFQGASKIAGEAATQR